MILDPVGPPLKAAAIKNTYQERGEARGQMLGKGGDAVRLGLQVRRCRLPEMGKDRGTCSLQNCVSKHLCC